MMNIKVITVKQKKDSGERLERFDGIKQNNFILTKEKMYYMIYERNAVMSESKL